MYGVRLLGSLQIVNTYKMNDVTVKDVLLYLQEAGWSDLVDERWKNKLETEIKTKFEYIKQDVLDEVLELVIY